MKQNTFSKWTTTFRRFFDICRDVYLFQLVSELTRVKRGQIEILLDLFLTTDDQIIWDIENLPGLGIRDHVCLMMDLYVYTQTEMYKKPRLRYQKARYKEMTNHL